MTDNINEMGKEGIIETFGLRKIDNDTYIERLEKYVGNDFKSITILSKTTPSFLGLWTLKIYYLLCSVNNSITHGNKVVIMVIDDDDIYLGVFNRIPINWGGGK